MKNVLLENMKRFGTKNLKEGWLDIGQLVRFRSEFETIMEPGQSADVIEQTVQELIDGLGGPTEAMKVIKGAFESVDKLKGLLKQFVRPGATMSYEMLVQIVRSLPFSPAEQNRLGNNIIKLAKEIGVPTMKKKTINEPETPPVTGNDRPLA